MIARDFLVFPQAMENSITSCCWLCCRYAGPTSTPRRRCRSSCHRRNATSVSVCWTRASSTRCPLQVSFVPRYALTIIHIARDISTWYCSGIHAREPIKFFYSHARVYRHGLYAHGDFLLFQWTVLCGNSREFNTMCFVGTWSFADCRGDILLEDILRYMPRAVFTRK